MSNQADAARGLARKIMLEENTRRNREKYSKNNQEAVYNILMFMVDKIYELSKGRNVVLKGGIALMDKLYAINPELVRYTSDIDLTLADKETYDLIFDNILREFNDNDKGLIFSIKKVRDRFETSKGYKFSVITNTGDVFSTGIDLQINQKGRIEVENGVRVSLKTYTVETMLSDKLSVLMSEKIYARAKDIYDVFILSSLKDYDMDYLCKLMKEKRENILNEKIIMFTTSNIDKIKTAYSALEGIPKVTEFEEVYKIVSQFTIPIYLNLSDGSYSGYVWKKGGSSWELHER